MAPIEIKVRRIIKVWDLQRDLDNRTLNLLEVSINILQSLQVALLQRNTESTQCHVPLNISYHCLVLPIFVLFQRIEVIYIG
jgi:hypothetical protein